MVWVLKISEGGGGGVCPYPYNTINRFNNDSKLYVTCLSLDTPLNDEGLTS